MLVISNQVYQSVSVPEGDSSTPPPHSHYMESVFIYPSLSSLKHKYHKVSPHLETSKPKSISLYLFSESIKSSGDQQGHLNTEGGVCATSRNQRCIDRRHEARYPRSE